jgi:hypothetical protein
LLTELTLVDRGVGQPKADGYDTHLGDVGVGQLATNGLWSEGSDAGKKHGNLDDVHPAQEVRVARSIGSAVGEKTSDATVDGGDSLDEGFSVTARAVGCGPDEGCGLSQATEWIIAEAGVLGHPRHGSGVQHLQEQGGESANEHRG